jgi:hypothetical protein
LRGDCRVEFLTVRECLRDGDDDTQVTARPYYLARLTVPYGPFQFDRSIKLG